MPCFQSRGQPRRPSRWVDPNTKNLFRGLNSCSIGIEIANAGNEEGALKWARKQPGFSWIKAKHRNGGAVVEWENYPAAQLKAVFAISKLLVSTYKLDDVIGPRLHRARAEGRSRSSVPDERPAGRVWLYRSAAGASFVRRPDEIRPQLGRDYPRLRFGSGE